MSYIVRGVVYDSIVQSVVDIWYAGGTAPHRDRFDGQHDVTLTEGYATELVDKQNANAARGLMDGARWNGQRIHNVEVIESPY